ncbi:MAG: hypothetical protein ABJA74_15895 [Lapillicoccus sp.]
MIARPNIIRAVFTAVIVALALPGIALAAKPVAAFHDHFTDSFAGDVCGIPVDIKLVVTDNFSFFADGSFKDTSSVRQTFTNPANGKSVVVSSAGMVTGTAVIDEQAGTISFSTTYKGLPEKIQTSRGAVLTRDAGVITFTDTFDLATGDFLGSEVIINGPHPEADSDFVLFCQVITAALT